MFEKIEVAKWVDNIYANIDKIGLSDTQRANLIRELVMCETWEQVSDIKARYNLAK